eukprot:gene344-1721_t
MNSTKKRRPEDNEEEEEPLSGAGKDMVPRRTRKTRIPVNEVLMDVSATKILDSMYEQRKWANKHDREKIESVSKRRADLKAEIDKRKLHNLTGCNDGDHATFLWATTELAEDLENYVQGLKGKVSEHRRTHHKHRIKEALLDLREDDRTAKTGWRIWVPLTASTTLGMLQKWIAWCKMGFMPTPDFKPTLREEEQESPKQGEKPPNKASNGDKKQESHRYHKPP